MSEGRAALVSASTLVVARVDAASTGGAGQNAGGGEESGSVMEASSRPEPLPVEKYREEKDGGGSELAIEAGRGCDSCSVYGGSSSQAIAVVRKEILWDTDDPSLAVAGISCGRQREGG